MFNGINSIKYYLVYTLLKIINTWVLTLMYYYIVEHCKLHACNFRGNIISSVCDVIKTTNNVNNSR